jgi:hypothetical protein
LPSVCAKTPEYWCTKRSVCLSIRRKKKSELPFLSVTGLQALWLLAAQSSGCAIPGTEQATEFRSHVTITFLLLFF